MDFCTFDWSKLRWDCSPSLLYIRVCMLEDYRYIPLSKNKQLGHCILGTDCSDHKELDYMDAVQLELKNNALVTEVFLQDVFEEALNKLTFGWFTLYEGISSHSSRTTANWQMIVNFANCVLPACTRTWIFAFISYTC